MMLEDNLRHTEHAECFKGFAFADILVRIDAYIIMWSPDSFSICKFLHTSHRRRLAVGRRLVACWKNIESVARGQCDDQRYQPADMPKRREGGDYFSLPAGAKTIGLSRSGLCPV